MTEDQDAKETQPDTGSKIFVNNNKYKKLKSQRPLTKVKQFLRKHLVLLLKILESSMFLFVTDNNATSAAYYDRRIIFRAGFANTRT